MSIRVNIPPEFEQDLRDAIGPEFERFVLESTLIEAYRLGKMSPTEMAKYLGLRDRWEVNSWLADRNIPLNYTLADLEADRLTLDRLLGKTA